MRLQQTLQRFRNQFKTKRRHQPSKKRSCRLQFELLETRVVPSGWTALANSPNTGGIQNMMLLSNGTVMALGNSNAGSNSASKDWFQLTPDSSGNYANGTWSQLNSMNLERLFFPSNVLPNGNVFVLGGEYSGPSTTKNWSNQGEIYNPFTNSWSGIDNFPQSQFGDVPTETLPGGKILAGSVFGFDPSTWIFDPSASPGNQWTFAANKLRNDRSDEETWLKLPDGSILSYDIEGSNSAGVFHAQRYIPSTNTWVDASNVNSNNPPGLLSDGSEELGPAFLLPDGNAFFVGNSGNTAIYTPSTDTWSAGPTVPNTTSCGDLPGAMMSNGDVLLAARNIDGHTHLWEFNPNTNGYTDVTPSGYNLDTNYPYMLDLPSGQVLLSDAYTNQLEVYTPPGSPNASWAPTVTNISGNTLTGTQLTGISEGASFGDDAEMSTNYPIISLTDNSGIVRYASTFNWSSTGVATGSALETTQFAMPSGAPNANLMNVSANGISSSNILYITDSTPNDTITLDTFSFTIFNITFDYITVTANGVSSSWFAPTVSSVFVNMNGSNETVDVRDTWSGIPTFINGGFSGFGADTVNIGNAGSVQGVAGNVTIENQPSYNTINIDDSNDGGPHTTTLQTVTIANDTDIDFFSDAFGQITGLAPGTISYEYFDTTSLTVKTGTGGNTVDVLATGSLQHGPGNRTTTLVGSSGGTTVNVGNGGTLTNILGALNIENEVSLDTVNINDQNDTTFQNNATLSTVIVKGSILGQLSGLVGAGGPIAPISWDYPDTAQVTINTGAAGATVTVLGAGVPTFINGNGATNTLVGGKLLTAWQVNTPNAGTLNNALANVTFTDFQNLTSGYGADGFIFANLATLSGTLNGGVGSGLSLFPYASSLTVNITGVGIGNISGVPGVVVGAFQGVQYLTTGTGNDSFIFGNAGYITSINSVGGTNTLDASAVNRSLSVSVYGTNAGTVPGMVFEFADIENFTGGSKNNTYVFSNLASLAGTLNGGSATNLLDMSPYISGLTFSVNGANTGAVAGVIGSFNHVQNLLGAGGGGNVFALSPLGSLSGELDGGFGGSNLLDYSAYTTGVTVNLSLNSATAVAGGVVNIQELRGGAGNDHLTGNGAGGTTFFASPGTDTITGLGSGNTLVGANTTNNWSITGVNAGKLVSPVGTTTYTGIDNLVGGTGLDTFKFSFAGKETSLTGGGAPAGQNDWLDYSAFTALQPVTVDLATGSRSATNVNGGAVNSIHGSIENVIGGAGADVLTGDNNGNILIEHGGAGTINGGTGRSLLIRGTGAATVNGGSSGDILIGGKTSYDTTNHVALMAILAEWQSGDPYPTRQDEINDGTIAGHPGVKLLIGSTVTLSTGGALNAAAGADLDWFFMTATQVHTALDGSEVPNNVS